MDKEANTKEQDPQRSEKPLVDLSALRNFDFGPSWGDTTSNFPASGDSAPRRSRPPRRRGAPKEIGDRRRPKPKHSPREARKKKGKDLSGKGPKRSHRHEPPKEVVDVAFYPEQKAFRALCHAMKRTSLTYELFEIARILLKKAERHIVFIRPLQASEGENDPDQEYLWVVEWDGMPFLDEASAMRHALSRCLDHFFTVETIEVDPPRGIFNVVKRCGITGELLGPPNYHRYKQMTRDHHASRLSKMPFHKFESRIETVQDEAVIKAWMEQMKTLTQYTLKPKFGGERVFQEAELAKSYVNAHLRDKLVRKEKSARLEGRQTAKLVDPLIKAYVDFFRDRQIRFPLETANRLRGRLRGQNIYLHKKGSKGVTYACAVKRKFRDPDQVLSDRVEKILKFLETRPGIPYREFTEQFLGFSILGQEGESAPELTEEQQERVKALRVDFRWLLKEGYVSEYADSKVFAHIQKKKAAAQKR